MKFGIVFGGASWEHEISIVSAVVMKRALKADLSFIFVDAQRNFYEISPEDMRANFFSLGKYKKCPKLHLTHGGFGKHGVFGLKKLDVDCYINLIHGCDGEDGKIAGLFSFYELKYIGPRLEASVLSFNKHLTKLLAAACGVKTLQYQTLRRGDDLALQMPVILKPARLGSSIGVSVISQLNQLQYALDVGFEFDDLIIAEPFIQGVREFNLAGFKADKEFVFSMIEEPSKKAFLDFEQKYLSFSSENAKKADISDKLQNALKQDFIKIYEAGGFDGALIRCDFFSIDEQVFLNEINPNPGSLANYLFDDFTSAVIKLAKSIKIEKKIKIEYNFISQISGQKGKMA